MRSPHRTVTRYRPAGLRDRAFTSLVKRLAGEIHRDVMVIANEAATQASATNTERLAARWSASRPSPIFGTLVTSIDQGKRPRLTDAVKEFERRYIVAVLAATGGNVSQTARILGVTRQALQQRLRRHGLGRRSQRRGTLPRSAPRK
jgi:DNA-binding NtrC family response regulator